MTTPPDDTFVDGLVGRPLEEATREATGAGWLVRPLPPDAIMTMDYRENRINLQHEDNVVTRAWIG